MKKLLPCLFILLISLNVCHSQKVGIKAGINFASALWETTGVTLATQALAGFQLGLIADFPISDPVYINTGVFFSMKGTKSELIGIEIKAPVNYLEIPVNLAYKIDVTSLKVYLQAGPYIGIGLSAAVEAAAAGVSVDIDFGSADDEIKALDVGLNFGAGIEVKAIQLGLNYGLGLTNLENVEDEVWKNRVFSVTIAYFF